MTETQELLIELTRRGINLQVGDGVIRYRAPHGTFAHDLKERLAAHRSEIIALYSGSSIADSLNRIADVWCTDIECRGEGDAAWAWIKASNQWLVICAAEDEVNRIGSRGNSDELNAACAEWVAAWVAAMTGWIRVVRNNLKIQR